MIINKLCKKDKKSNIDGNRDFYYLIKGITSDFNCFINNDKDKLIVKMKLSRNIFVEILMD